MIVLPSDSALSFVSAEWLPFAAMRCLDPVQTNGQAGRVTTS